MTEKLDEYVAVRVKVVRVKKGFLGRMWDKEQLGAITLIQNEKRAYNIYKKIEKMFEKEGVAFEVPK